MKTAKTLFKITAYLLAGIALAVILPFTVWAILHDSPDLADTLENNWGIVLSDESGWDEIYHADSGVSFNGDGERYHIVTYEQEDMIENMVAWSAEEGKTRWHDSYQAAIDEWISYTDTEPDMYPDHDGCMYWYQRDSDGSEIIMCWNKAEAKIYIAESFM